MTGGSGWRWRRNSGSFRMKLSYTKLFFGPLRMFWIQPRNSGNGCLVAMMKLHSGIMFLGVLLFPSRL